MSIPSDRSYFNPGTDLSELSRAMHGEYDLSAVELNMRNSEYQPSASRVALLTKPKLNCPIWKIGPTVPNMGAVIQTLENGQHDTAVPAIYAYTGSDSHETSSDIMPDDVHKPTRDSR
ncbi:hypothetical protein C8R45DRAFT_1069580 [Mycena sanguinolenta]|nr:hypothetical protein C8R45DRAFT_1082622 [Mycena sanguinolenta]KAJ6509032.1 hypothetical protein C8R45DRAFT_1069580 [Mycena sanguinolenta]